MFADELRTRLEAVQARRGAVAQWVLILPDQLNLAIGPIARTDRRTTGIVLLESGEWLSRRPYHRQRLAWIILAQRSFALEAAEAGFAVRYLRGDEPRVELARRFALGVEGRMGLEGRTGLESGASSAASSGAAAAPSAGAESGHPLEGHAPHGFPIGSPGARGLVAMEPAEREMRAEFAPLCAAGLLRFGPHEGFLTTAADLERGRTAEGWRMDRFYQGVRQRTGILMEGGKPLGGKYSFDAENRRRWDGVPAAPHPPEFPGSLLREEIVDEIETRFAAHPGTLDIATIPASQAEIDRLWQWARRSCLPNFGPFEDAMSRRSRGVFHTRISPLMNLHRLLPQKVVADSLALEVPLASKEGFIRQVLGWREFVYQVHRATDGFRAPAHFGASGEGVSAGSPAKKPHGAPHGALHGALHEAPLPAPGDGGYQRWAQKPWRPKGPPPAGVDGGARPNRLGADLGVPPAYWGTPSGLACLDHVVEDVWAEGWSHHITRLMVLANIATLAGVSPRELCDWFWIAYIDAWDWVVEPNVLAMGTYGWDGMTTKPYVSGSAYLEKMGDSCGSCRFTPGKDCPIGPMYWAFLARNDAALCDNPRMKLPLASARNRTEAQKAHAAGVFVSLRDMLIEGRRVDGGGAR